MQTSRLDLYCVALAVMFGLIACGAERADDSPAAEDRGSLPTVDAGPRVGASVAYAPSTMPLLNVASGAQGEYLTDHRRRALYLLEGDSEGDACSGACLTAWPPLMADPGVDIAATPSLASGKIGTIQRTDGGAQVTFNGHPLYRYAKDGGAGSTDGHHMEDEWGEWYLITPEGTSLQSSGEDSPK